MLQVHVQVVQFRPGRGPCELKLDRPAVRFYCERGSYYHQDTQRSRIKITRSSIMLLQWYRTSQNSAHHRHLNTIFLTREMKNLLSLNRRHFLTLQEYKAAASLELTTLPLGDPSSARAAVVVVFSQPIFTHGVGNSPIVKAEMDG